MVPGYKADQHGGSLQPPQRKSLVNIKSQATVENTELADMPQRASDVNTAVKQLFTETGTNTDGLPYEICLHWMTRYSVIVVHLLIISRNYTNWTQTLPTQNMN